MWSQKWSRKRLFFKKIFRSEVKPAFSGKRFFEVWKRWSRKNWPGKTFFEVKLRSEAGLSELWIFRNFDKFRTKNVKIFFARAFGARYDGFYIMTWAKTQKVFIRECFGSAITSNPLPLAVSTKILSCNKPLTNCVFCIVLEARTNHDLSLELKVKLHVVKPASCNSCTLLLQSFWAVFALLLTLSQCTSQTLCS